MNLKGSTKGLILDCDGVILDSVDRSIIQHQRFAQHKGYQVPSYNRLRRLWGLPWSKVIKTIWPQIDADKFMDEFVKFSTSIWHPSVPGALNSLMKLKGTGLVLSLLTSREQETLFWHLDDMDIFHDMFLYIRTHNKDALERPDPRIFQTTIEQFKRVNVSKQEITYVGDTLYDFQAAQAAQIRFIGVLTGAAIKQEFQEAGVQDILDSISDLPDFLEV
jgi:phosphoglycolate phosphatase-like HAD superfamily hydrolase